jgi:hypothetical protein
MNGTRNKDTDRDDTVNIYFFAAKRDIFSPPAILALATTIPVETVARTRVGYNTGR